MPMEFDENSAELFKQKAESLLNGIRQGLPIIGEIARDEIVRATLAGIGAGDQPFTKYSKQYVEVISAVGGKTGGVVDLRGIFYKKGGKPSYKFKDSKSEARRSRNALRKGAERQSFARVTIGGKSFYAKTAVTRPRAGLVDRLSEMSADLITVKVNDLDFSIELTYKPRRETYMIDHQHGRGNMPQRKWFSIEKTNVRGAVAGAMREMMKALVADFNS